MSVPLSLFRLSVLALAVSGSNLAYAEEQNLPNVPVSGKRSITNNWKTTSERNVSDMRDVLADRADVNVGGGNVSAQFVSIRAAGQNRIDMVVDNTSTATQLWYHQGRFQLDPEMVRVIGVDKGAGSASAGIGLTSGAIRSQTVDAKDLLLNNKPFGARISTQYNSNKGMGGNVAVYGNSHGFDALLMGSWRDNKNYKAGKGYQNPNQANEVLNSARKQGNYLAKLSYDISPDHKIGISYRREHYFGNSWERPEFANIGTDTGKIDTVQQTVNAQYTGKNVGFLQKIDANVFHLRGEDERLNWQRKMVGGKQVNYDAGGGRVSNTKTTGANLNFSSPLFEGKHEIKYGLNWRNERISTRAGDVSVKNGERKNEVGVYVEGIWSLEPVTLTTGLRYDHFDLRTSGKTPSSSKNKASAGSVNPSLGVIWSVLPNLSLHAKLNYASRSPALASAYTLIDNRAGKARGLRDVDSNLKPERARLAELGFQWQHKGLNLSGNIFQQQVKNYFTSLNSSPISNRGTLKTNGYELDATYTWKGLTARMGVAYANPKTTFPLGNDPLEIIPQGRQWRTGLAYRFNQPNLEVGWRGRFAESKTFYTGVNRDKQHREGFGVHDIYANWKPIGEALNVNVAVNNVGNKLYKSHSQRVSAIAPYNPGREVRLGVNYRF